MDFRALRADEIECRIGTCSEKGVSILLYKDARADMRLLDETVGAENWDCEYTDIGGRLYCTVGIYCMLDDESMHWVYKQDVGTESNTEAEKGQASDAFKRACVKWGIGRELYTAPFIWIPHERLQKHAQDRNGKWKCWDRFKVRGIGYDDGKITMLDIVNQYDFGVFRMGNG